MSPNDVLRSLRYTLRINNEQVCKIFALGDLPCSEQDAQDLMLEEEDPHFLPLAPPGLDAFLNGLVVFKRGPRPEGAPIPQPEERFCNNVTLKKLKVAFALKDTDMDEIFKLGGFALSKGEISAFTQARSHRNFKLCRDQVLRYFLRGLARKLNPKALKAMENAEPETEVQEAPEVQE